MIKNTLTILLALFAFAVSAQKTNQTDQQGRKNGLWKKYYANGKLRYEGVFKHGVEQDTFRFYFDDGALQALNYFRGNGVMYSRQYGEGKKLAAEGKYINKKRDSTWTFYDADGNMVSRENYSNGQKDGSSTTYFENKRPAEITNYKNGVKEGEWKQFYDNGKPRAKGKYVNGHLSGEVLYYDVDGTIHIKGQYIKGIMDGKWYYFDNNHNIVKTQVWHFGILKSQDPPEEKNTEDIDTIPDDTQNMQGYR